MSAKLKLYHPTSKGTGCAIGLELHPATAEQEGSIILEMAHQRTVGEIIGKSEFDWNDTACVRLGFNELTKVLQVLRGETESVEGERGLMFGDPKVTRRMMLRHVFETCCGYSLEVSRYPEVDGGKYSILLTNAEALGICEAISAAMVWVAFGDPHAPCRCAERRAE